VCLQHRFVNRVYRMFALGRLGRRWGGGAFIWREDFGVWIILKNGSVVSGRMARWMECILMGGRVRERLHRDGMISRCWE